MVGVTSYDNVTIVLSKGEARIIKPTWNMMLKRT